MSIIERLSARGRVGGSTVNFSVGLVHFVLDLIQQIEKVSQQESELHKTTIQLSCKNLIILYGEGGSLVLYLSNCGYALSLPFNLLKHLSDSKQTSQPLVAKSVVLLATPCALYCP